MSAWSPRSSKTSKSYSSPLSARSSSEFTVVKDRRCLVDWVADGSGSEKRKFWGRSPGPVDPLSVAHLARLGFKRETARNALVYARNNVALAIELAIHDTHDDGPIPDCPVCSSKEEGSHLRHWFIGQDICRRPSPAVPNGGAGPASPGLEQSTTHEPASPETPRLETPPFTPFMMGPLPPTPTLAGQPSASTSYRRMTPAGLQPPAMYTQNNSGGDLSSRSSHPTVYDSAYSIYSPTMIPLNDTEAGSRPSTYLTASAKLSRDDLGSYAQSTPRLSREDLAGTSSSGYSSYRSSYTAMVSRDDDSYRSHTRNHSGGSGFYGWYNSPSGPGGSGGLSRGNSGEDLKAFTRGSLGIGRAM